LGCNRKYRERIKIQVKFFYRIKTTLKLEQ
jgi:hypothetical protein